jgi:hypothetical protein
VQGVVQGRHWLNRIAAQFQALPYFTPEPTDHTLPKSRPA